MRLAAADASRYGDSVKNDRVKTYVASRSPCPVGRASRILGDRWIMLLLREIFLGVDRFDGFLARLPISRATLTARLNLLVDAGIVSRIPPDARRSRYVPTPAGQALRPFMESMQAWGTAWLPVQEGRGDEEI